MGVHKDPKTGKYRIRVKYFGKEFEKVIGKSRQQANFALAEIKQEIRLAKLSGQGWEGFAKLQRAQRPKMFGEAAQQYMDERRDGKVSSKRAYKSIFSAYLLPRFSNRTLASITEAELRAFLVELTEDKGLSKSRANTIMQLMRALLAQAAREGQIDRDPTLMVKRLKAAKTKVDPFSEEDLTLVLSNIQPHYQPCFTVQAFSGCRPAELLALRWRDIDWVNEQICINKARVRGHEGTPKTASGERLVPMTRPVTEALQQLKRQPVASLDDFVFTNTKGRPIDNHLGDVWNKALKQAGLHHRPSYQLRHTFITQCILKGRPLPYIAKIVGHSTIDTLIRHYARWIESATQEEEKKLRDSFGMSFATLGTPQMKKVGVKGGVMAS